MVGQFILIHFERYYVLYAKPEISLCTPHFLYITGKKFQFHTPLYPSFLIFAGKQFPFYTTLYPSFLLSLSLEGEREPTVLFNKTHSHLLRLTTYSGWPSWANCANLRITLSFIPKYTGTCRLLCFVLVDFLWFGRLLIATYQ